MLDLARNAAIEDVGRLKRASGEAECLSGISKEVSANGKWYGEVVQP
jgi:hypothetical protein